MSAHGKTSSADVQTRCLHLAGLPVNWEGNVQDVRITAVHNPLSAVRVKIPNSLFRLLFTSKMENWKHITICFWTESHRIIPLTIRVSRQLLIVSRFICFDFQVLSHLPEFISSRVTCFYGEKYLDSCSDLKEVCELMKQLRTRSQRCHVASYDRLVKAPYLFPATGSSKVGMPCRPPMIG